MRSKRGRPGKCRASFSFKKRWLKAGIFILILCVVVAVLMYTSSAANLDLDKKQTQEAEPINITIPQPCKTGKVTVYAQGRVIYQYGGEISIRNDGKNGEEIEIVVEYPEEWKPDSCFEEE